MTNGFCRLIQPRLPGRKGLISLTAVTAALALIAVSLFSAAAVAPANPAFQDTWARTDQPVSSGQAERTWMWGPAANTSAMQEAYAESPGGMRTVQYYDKTRMEINNPSGDQSSLWYVTNGLLVREMIIGEVQVGDATFEPHAVADTINVAGDPDDPNGPTYASFASRLGDPALPIGTVITQRLARNGDVSTDTTLTSYGITAAHRVTVTDIDHTVASVFWDFMNSTGVVYQGGQFVQDSLFVNPFYATGYPIGEAFWANIKVANNQQDVLIQCFERRCLTWTPGNPDGWKVEAGNVGQHYFRWRYEITPPTPTPTPSPTPGPAPEVSEGVFSAYLAGANVVPPVTTDGAGTAYFYVHADGSGVDFSINTQGLTNVTAASIREGSATENGNVVVTLFSSAKPVTTNGVLASGSIVQANLPADWTIADLEAGMADGSLYVDIQTTGQTSGAVRGQLGALGDTSFNAVLLGGNQSPPTTSTAVGALGLSYHAADATLDYELYVLNMTKITAAHIHSGVAGANGPVVATLFTAAQPVTGPFNGMLAEGTLDAGDLTGQTMPHFVYLLLTGGAYGNVHSVDYPDGEIRGQIQVGNQTDLGAATYIASLDNTAENDFMAMYMPIDTDASGLALLWPSKDGKTLNYVVIVTNIDRVLSAQLRIDGVPTAGEVVTMLFDSTANATGPVNGVLASGVINDAAVIGPLKNTGVSGLLGAIDVGEIWVGVTTVQNPAGDIWGLVAPIS